MYAYSYRVCAARKRAFICRLDKRVALLEDLHLMRGIRYFSLYKVQKGFAGFIFGATGAIRTNAETRVAAKSAARKRAFPRLRSAETRVHLQA